MLPACGMAGPDQRRVPDWRVVFSRPLTAACSRRACTGRRVVTGMGWSGKCGAHSMSGTAAISPPSRNDPVKVVRLQDVHDLPGTLHASPSRGWCQLALISQPHREGNPLPGKPGRNDQFVSGRPRGRL